jgi:predicted transcriptional regulator
LHQELLTELQTANKNVQRISYTSRIIDIIGSIKKQNNDIDKILGDTRELQKSIARLQEQLNRQYKVSDDLLFQVNLFIGFFEFLIKVGWFFPTK